MDLASKDVIPLAVYMRMKGIQYLHDALTHPEGPRNLTSLGLPGTAEVLTTIAAFLETNRPGASLKSMSMQLLCSAFVHHDGPKHVEHLNLSCDGSSYIQGALMTCMFLDTGFGEKGAQHLYSAMVHPESLNTLTTLHVRGQDVLVSSAPKYILSKS